MVSNPTSQEVSVTVTSDGADATASKLAGVADGANKIKGAVGAASVALGALAAGGIAKSVDAAASFESQMADVQKVTSKGTAGKLKQDIKDISAEIPIAKGELATLAEQAGKFGVEGSENISKFVKTVGKIQTATDLAAEEAGKRFAKIAGAVGLPMEDIDKLGNATNKLADSMKTDAGEITDTATRSANTLSQQLGLGKSAVLSLSASMNEVSPSARRAAGSLRRAGEALMDPKKAEDIASAIGLSTEKFRSMREESPEKLLNKVAATMNKGGEGATALRGSLGKAATAFSKIGKQQSATKKAQEAVNKQFENGTSLGKEMGIRTDTLAGQYKLLKNQVSNAAVTIGDAYLPIIKDAISVVSPLIDRISAFVEGLSETQLLVGTLAPTISLLAGGAGLLAAKFGVLGTAISGTGTALSALLGPLSLMIAGVGALGAAFATNFGNIRGATSEVVSAIDNQLLTTAHTINATFGPILAELANSWASMGGRVESVAAGLFDTIAYRLVGAIERAGSRFRGQLAKIAIWWEQHGAAVTSTINQFSTHIQEAFIQLMAGISTAIAGDGEGEASFAYFFKEALGEMLAAARSLGITLPEPIRSALSRVSTAVSTKLGQVLAWWDTHKRQVRTKARAAYGKARSAVSSSIGKVRETVSSALSRAEAAWNTHAPRVRQKASAAYQKARTKISSALSTLNSAVVQPALSRAKGEWDRHKKDIKRVAGGAIDWLKQHWDSVLATLLGTVLVPGLGSMYQAFKDNFELVKKTTRNTLGALKTTVRTLMGAIETQIVQPLTNAESRTRQTFREIGTEVSQSLGLVRDVVSRVVATVLNVWNSHISEMAAVWKTHLSGSDGIIANARNAFNALWTGVIKPALDTIQAAWKKWGDEIIGVVRGALNTVLTVGRIGMDAILTTINVLLDIIAGDWEGAWNSIAGFVERTLGELGSWLESTGAAIITTAIDVIITAIKTPFEKLYDFLIGGSLIPTLISDITAAFENWSIVETVTGILSSVLDGFESLKEDALGEIKNLGSDAIGAVQSWGNKLLRKFSKLRELALNRLNRLKEQGVKKIKGLGSDAVSAVVSWGNKLLQKFSKLKELAINRVENLAEGVMDWLTGDKGPLSNVRSAGKSLIGDFVSGIRDKIGAVGNAMSDVMDKVDNFTPGSDADEGPLSNLTDWGPDLAKTFAVGITANADEVADAARRAAEAARVPFAADAPAGTVAPRTASVVANTAAAGAGGGDSTYNDVTVNAEVRVDGEATREDGETVADALLDRAREQGLDRE